MLTLVLIPRILLKDSKDLNSTPLAPTSYEAVEKSMRQIKLVKQSTCHRNILQADYDSNVLYRMDAVIFVALESFGSVTFP